MTDVPEFRFQASDDSYLDYLKDRASRNDPEAQRQLSRMELRQTERGFLEALTTTSSGRDRSFTDLLGFFGTANEVMYLDKVREAREAMDDGNATAAQRKLYERWEDFSYRQSTWWATVGDIAADAPAFMQEMAVGNIAAGAFRAAATATAKTAIRGTLAGRTAAAIARPIRKFDAGLANVIQRSAAAAQKTATPEVFGQVGLSGIAAGLTRAATIGAGEQVVAQTAIGEAFGAVYGGGSRYRLQQLGNWLHRNGARDPVTGALKALDNEFGLWTNAAPALIDLYIEMMSEMSGHALVMFPAATKIALTGKGFEKSGTSNRMLSLLGLSADPADLRGWSRSSFSGIVPEIGEEFVGAAARDSIATIAPELAEGGNLEYLVDNIGAVSMGLALGMGAPAALQQTRNHVDAVLDWSRYPDGAKKAYETVRDTFSKAEREAVVGRTNNVMDFVKKGFSTLGSAQIALSEPLRASFYSSDDARAEARARVIQGRDEGDLRPPTDAEIEEELGNMFGQLLDMPLLNEDGTQSPILEELVRTGAIPNTPQARKAFLNEVRRRSLLLQEAVASGSVEGLARLHAEEILARDIADRDRASESEALRIARDRDVASLFAEELEKLQKAAGLVGPTVEGDLETRRRRAQEAEDLLAEEDYDAVDIEEVKRRLGELDLPEHIRELLSDALSSQDGAGLARELLRIEGELREEARDERSPETQRAQAQSAADALSEALGGETIALEVGAESRGDALIQDEPEVIETDNPDLDWTIAEVQEQPRVVRVGDELVIEQGRVVVYRYRGKSPRSKETGEAQRSRASQRAMRVSAALKERRELLPRIAELEQSQAQQQERVAQGLPAVPVERKGLERATVESLMEGLPQARQRPRLRRALGEATLDAEDEAGAASAIDLRVAQLAQEAGLQAGELQVVNYQATDVPGQGFAVAIGAQIVEVEGPASSVPPAFFDEETGLIYIDRARLAAQAQTQETTPEDYINSAVLHEVTEAALASIEDQQQPAVVAALDNFLTTMGFPASQVASELARYGEEYSDADRQRESVALRIERFAKLIKQGRMPSDAAVQAAKVDGWRKYLQGLMGMVLPRSTGTQAFVRSWRQTLQDAGYNTEGMTDEQVLAYSMTADAINEFILKPDLPIRRLMRPAMDDLEEALAGAPAGFWDRVRGERPLPRPETQRDARTGLETFVMPGSQGAYGALAAELEETTGVPTQAGAIEDPREAREQAVRDSDAVIVFGERKKSKDAVKQLEKVAGDRPVIYNPRPRQLRKWMEENQVQRPAYIQLTDMETGGAAVARESLLGSLGGLEFGGTETRATPTFEPLEELGPYGGLTAQKLIERWREGADIPELETARGRARPRDIEDADSVVFVGQDTSLWEEVEKQVEGREIPTMINPVRFTELQSFLAHHRSYRPLFVGSPVAVKIAEQMFKEATSTKRTVQSLIVPMSFTMGIDPTVTKPHEMLVGQVAEVIPWQVETNWGRPTYNPRGELLYPETEMYLVPDQIIGTKQEEQLERARVADIEELAQMALDLKIPDRELWFMDRLRKGFGAPTRSELGRLQTPPTDVTFGATSPVQRPTDPRLVGDVTLEDTPEGRPAVGQAPMLERDDFLRESLRWAVKTRIIENVPKTEGSIRRVDARPAEGAGLGRATKLDPSTYTMPHRLLVPFANAQPGDDVLLVDKQMQLVARVKDIDGDVAVLEYTESSGKKRTRRAKTSNIFHDQLSLALSGEMPLWDESGNIVRQGRLRWRRGILRSRKAPRQGEPRPGQAALEIAPQEGESASDYRARVLAEGYKLLEAYPRMLDIAFEGRYVPTLENADTESRRQQREMEAILSRAGQRGALWNAIADMSSASVGTIAPPNLFKIVGGKRPGLRVDFSRTADIRSLMNDLRSRGQLSDSGQIEDDPQAELNAFEREMMEVMESGVRELFSEIGGELYDLKSGRMNLRSLLLEIKDLTRKRRNDPSRMTDREAALRMLADAMADASVNLSEKVGNRMLALQGGEALQAMRDMTAEDPLAVGYRDFDDEESRDLDKLFFDGVMNGALGARSTARRLLLNVPRVGQTVTSAEAELLRPEVEDTDLEFMEAAGLDVDQSLVGVKELRLLVQQELLDLGARQTMLPEVAGRMMTAAWSLYSGEQVVQRDPNAVPLMQSQLARWAEQNEGSFLMRVFDSKQLSQLGGVLAPTMAHAAMLHPRPLSDMEHRRKDRDETTDKKLRHSTLTLVAQMVQAAGYGPSANGVRQLQPLVAATDATIEQLLELLDLPKSAADIKQLTPRELAAAIVGGPKMKQHENDVRDASERELLRILSDADDASVIEWFESNMGKAAIRKRQADAIVELDAIDARFRAESKRTGRTVSELLEDEAFEGVVQRSNELNEQLRQDESLEKLRERLAEDGSLKAFKAALKKYDEALRKGRKTAEERNTALRASQNFYKDLAQLPYFRQGRGRKVLRAAKTVQAVRAARLMLDYDVKNAESAERIMAMQAQGQTDRREQTLGLISEAINPTKTAMQRQHSVLAMAEELLLETRFKEAAMLLAKDHAEAPVLQHVARASRTTRIGQARGLDFMEKMVRKAGLGGDEILIVPRGGIDFFVPLDPTVIVAPNAISRKQLRSLREAQQEEATLPLYMNRMFGIVDEFAFTGTQSAAGYMRNYLRRAERDALFEEVTEALFGSAAVEALGKKRAKKLRKKAFDKDGNLKPEVAIEVLEEVDETLAKRFETLVKEYDRRNKKRRVSETRKERSENIYSLLFDMLQEAHGSDPFKIKDVTPRGVIRADAPSVHEVINTDDPTQRLQVAIAIQARKVAGNAREDVVVVGFPKLPSKFTPQLRRLILTYGNALTMMHQYSGQGRRIEFDLRNMPDEVRNRFDNAGHTQAPQGKGVLTASDLAQVSPEGPKMMKVKKRGKLKNIRPRLGPEEKDYTDKQREKMERLKRVSDVRVPQLWNADLLPKGQESDFDTGLFLATYDDWHSKTSIEQMEAMRQHRLNRDRLERWADTQGVKGFAYKRLLRDVAEAMLVRIDLDYWVHNSGGYSRGVNTLSYTKGDDQSLWNALEARAKGKAKYTQRHRDIFKLAKAIRTEEKYAPIRELIRDMNDQQSRITKIGRAAELFKGSIYSYASLGWKQQNGERIYEPVRDGVSGSAIGLLEQGAAGGPLREDVGYRRMEKKLVSVLDGWSQGYDLILPNALDAQARTHRVVTEARYNNAWIKALEAAGAVKVIPEGKPSPGYVRLKADALSMYQAVPWIARYINNATTHFGLSDIQNPILRNIMRMNFTAKHLMLMFGFFHHQAFMRSYLFTVAGKDAKEGAVANGGVASAALASGASYAKAVGRMSNAQMARLESRFEPMRKGREAWEKKHEDFMLLMRAGLTAQLSNEMTQTMGGAYYTPEDTADVDRWFDKVREKIQGFGAASGLTNQMLQLVDNMRIAQRETAEWLFNSMGANMKIAAAMSKLDELRAKNIERYRDDPDYAFEMARIAAEQVNADFGGLDLRGRSGKLSDYFGEPGPRNPVTQMTLRGLFLAPDWTESNAVAFLGMLKRGKRFATPTEIQNIQRAAYRTMWGRVAGRALMLQLALNMALAVADPDRTLADMYTEAGMPGFGDEDAPKAKKLRWLDANISMFSPTESRKFLSVWGHFMDPAKWTVDALSDGFLSPVQRKGSSAMRGLYEFVTGANWADRRYNTLQEFAGWDSEVYEYATMDDDGTMRMPGERKPGRYEGLMTRPSSRTGSVKMDELPLWAFDQSLKFVPLQIRALIDYAMGSHDALDAFAQVLGAKMSRTYPDQNEEADTDRDPDAE